MNLKIRHLKRAIAALFCISAVSVQAIDLVQTNEFVVAETNTLETETWLSAENIDITGSVASDLLATTQNASLDGVFQQDVWCIGGRRISASGDFQNDARLLAQTIQFFGTASGPVIAAGNTVKIGRGAVLENGLLCLGETMILEGDITGDVKVFAANVTLGGTINGDVQLTAPKITVLPKTIINGDLTYTAPGDLVLPASATLSGTLHKNLPPPKVVRLFKSNLPLHFMFGLAALVTGLVFAGLFPRYTGAAVHAIRHSTGTCILIGSFTIIPLPLIGGLLLFTGFGTTLGLLILLAYGMLAYLSKMIVAYWIGSRILRRKDFSRRTAAAPLALGLLVLYTLIAVNALSFIIHVLLIIFGLGALLVALFKKPVLVINANELPQNHVS